MRTEDMKRTVNVYYADIRNMGDQLNVRLLEQCFGIKVRRTSFLDGEISAIGSGLDMYCLHGTAGMQIYQRLCGIRKPSVEIWGTGFVRWPDPTMRYRFFKRKMHFCAVRGELTRKRVEQMLGRPLDIPTGDGGILVSELVPETVGKRWEVGIIPHICDWGLPLVEKVQAAYPDSHLIDLRKDVTQVLEEIAACRVVVSSSLHGLVAADSFHIPSRHLVLSDRMLGDGYKFDDYYSAYGAAHPLTDVRVEALPSVAEIVRTSVVTPQMADRKKWEMREAFPAFARGKGE